MEKVEYLKRLTVCSGKFLFDLHEPLRFNWLNQNFGEMESAPNVHGLLETRFTLFCRVVNYYLQTLLIKLWIAPHCGQKFREFKELFKEQVTTCPADKSLSSGYIIFIHWIEIYLLDRAICS